MKKSLFLILLLLVPALAFMSCDDDKDLPNVNFTVAFENPVVDNTVYVVAGDTVKLTSVTVQNVETNKAAAVTGVNYYLDGYYLGASIFAPYPISIPVSESAEPGEHFLELEAGVVAVDKSPAFAVLGYDIEVVSSADDIPSEATAKVLTGNAKTFDHKK